MDDTQRVEGRARREGQPELLVLVTGGDVLVPARVHSRGHANQYGSDNPGGGREPAKHPDLRHRVDDDAPDSHLERAAQFGVGLVVAVQSDALTRRPAAQGKLEFSPACHVDA